MTTNDLPRLTVPELQDAITEGVRRAMWQMITSATSAPCQDFYAAVEDGVERAMRDKASEPDHPIPMILCERTGSSGGVPQWKFWCPFCAAYHHHGGEVDVSGDIGHRNAHCTASHSPYHRSGYVLRELIVQKYPK